VEFVSSATTDYITSTQGHGHCGCQRRFHGSHLPSSARKEAGYCRGKGGSMHIADPATGTWSECNCGGSAGIATGAALSSKRLGTGQVAVCFFGEGRLDRDVPFTSDDQRRCGNCRDYVCEKQSLRIHALFGNHASTSCTRLHWRHASVKCRLVFGQDSDLER